MIRFTGEQQSVIDARDQNILVSAAAGSGKTAVLVERIIGLITGEGKGTAPVDIDRILVVTFTRAAAAQMKERILNAVNARLRENPDNAHLQRQETLIHNAQITTIDAFCGFVIRNHFSEIDLDPACRVGDEGEMKLLQKRAMEEVLEEAYAANSEETEYAAEYFAPGAGDAALEEAVLKLYTFAMSTPWPEEWLSEHAADYCVPEDGIGNAAALREVLLHAKEELEDIKDGLSQAKALCEAPAGPYMYLPMLEEDLELVNTLCFLDSYAAVQERLRRLIFTALSRKKDDTVDPALRERVKKMRKECKDALQELQGRYFSLPLNELQHAMQGAGRAVKELCRLTLRFKEAFDELKRDRLLMDFHDMEHFALQILLQKEGDAYVPTSAARSLSAYYHEIMIDEYQDSNSVQELLLKSVAKEREGGYNRFMVGDIKQSIYKFRLARPEIFMEKLSRYEKGTDAEEAAKLKRRRIDLHANFRSRKEVLDGVNYIFGRIMGEDLGGVAYDEDARLIAGASYPEDTDGMFVPEVLIVRPSGETKEPEDARDAPEAQLPPDFTEQPFAGRKRTAKETEALAVAQKIRDLIRTGRLTNADGTGRAVSFRDIVILLRATSGWDETFRRVLTQEGIPAYVETRTGYFSTQEIMAVLHLFRVLDNPLQDIPFVSVAKSYFGQFTDEELAKIRVATKEEAMPFYRRFVLCAQEAFADDALREKAAAFLAFINEFRERKEYLPVHTLLRQILDDTGYRDYVSALPAGAQRTANLDMLNEKASAFEQTGFQGLTHFVQYIEQLEKYEVDYGEANILDEASDVVRIMSIHKSKGLEFPVVIVAGLAKKFNLRDSSAFLLTDVDSGIGVPYLDATRRVQYPTPQHTLIADKMKTDAVGEELRVLYVAMTRAMEKLILVASDKDPARTFERLSFRCGQAGTPGAPELLPRAARKNAMSNYEFVMTALATHPKCREMFEQTLPAVTITKEDAENEELFLMETVGEEALLGADVAAAVQDVSNRLRLLSEADTDTGAGAEAVEELRRRISLPYAHDALRHLYAKTTVTELKARLHAQEEGEEAVVLLPGLPETDASEAAGSAPIRSRGVERAANDTPDVDPTTRGTAYHKVFELVDAALMDALREASGLPGEDGADMDTSEKRTREAVLKDWMREQASLRRMPEVYCDIVKARDVLHFLDSPLWKRMERALGAGTLYRERPFVLGLPASRLDPAFPAEETVLIQGIIDAYFIEDGEIVVVDYKTDRVKKDDIFVQRYRVQLDYYEEALQRITHLPVKEKLIYAVETGHVIAV